MSKCCWKRTWTFLTRSCSSQRPKVSIPTRWNFLQKPIRAFPWRRASIPFRISFLSKIRIFFIIYGNFLVKLTIISTTIISILNYLPNNHLNCEFSDCIKSKECVLEWYHTCIIDWLILKHVSIVVNVINNHLRVQLNMVAMAVLILNNIWSDFQIIKLILKYPYYWKTHPIANFRIFGAWVTGHITGKFVQNKAFSRTIILHRFRSVIQTVKLEIFTKYGYVFQ